MTRRKVAGEWGALAGAETLPPAEVEARARRLLGQMTLLEKVKQMSGDGTLWRDGPAMARAYNAEPIPAGENPRLGIPGIRFSDGPRGVVMYHSTCFPVSMARGASWDPDLEERIGDAIGVEARSQGANFFGGVCINLLRHPAWGRAQETYGEDPYHLGEMGAALVRGVQRHIMACAKHYALNSIENARMFVDVQADERTLHEVYLPHFKRCVEEGVASIMSAYNKVNGEHCGHNWHLLRDILKEEWGFTGFVVSDFVWGIRDGRAAAVGGLDIEMPFTMHYGRKLVRLVRRGKVPEVFVDEAVLRILRQKIRFSRIGEPDRYGPHAVVSGAHRALAREAAVKSMVLLKNDPLPPGGRPLLPLDRAALLRLAVIGRLAAEPNIGDRGSSQVRPPHVVTLLEGLRAAAGGTEVLYDDGQDVAAACAAAGRANAAVLVAGYTWQEEGEHIDFMGRKYGGDRQSLALSSEDEQLIRAVSAANERCVVVLVGGSAIVTEAWRAQVPAVLMAWYPGMEGGHALADLLFGAANPSGRLPFAVPRSPAQLPAFDCNAKEIRYDLFHGYRLMDRRGEEPAFPFGFGLSYTTFRYDRLELEQDPIAGDGSLRVRVQVCNTGATAGDEVVQLYVGCDRSAVDRPVKELKAFARISLGPGESRTVSLEVPASRLAYYDPDLPGWVVEPGRYTVWVGPSAAAGSLLQAACRVSD